MPGVAATNATRDAINGDLISASARIIEVIIISGIIPLVPGIPAYNAIFHLLNEDYVDGISASVETLLSGGAIAITTTLARSYKRKRK